MRAVRCRSEDIVEATAIDLGGHVLAPLVAMPCWPPLRPGDLVDLVAPAWGCPLSELSLCDEYLRGLQLRVRIPHGILCRPLDWTSEEAVEWSPSAQDDTRSRQLRMALEAEDSAAVFCLRGGYGSAIAMESLPTQAPRRAPKLFVGCSDLTHVHALLTMCWGWPTLHGDHILPLIRNPSRRIPWEAVVFGHQRITHLLDLAPLNDAAHDVPESGLHGTVLGGNLTTISLAIGTPWALRGKSAILLIEDDNGEPFHTERLLMHLRQAGIFDGAISVVFGDFRVSDDLTKGGFASLDTKAASMLSMRSQFARTFLSDVPVVATDLVGHGAVNRPIPFGTFAKLFRTDGQLELECETGAGGN